MTILKDVFRIMVIALLVAAGSALVRAGDRSGTISEEFLKIPTSARAIGIGGAQVAVAEGASSLGFNPAGILSVNDVGVGITYTAWLADIQHSFAGIVKNIPGVGAIGASVTVLRTDDMIETTPQFPEGTGRTFNASDYAFGLAYARQVTDQFRVGVEGKWIQSYLYNSDYGASTFAVDIGTLYDIPVLRSHLGVSLTNIGRDVTFIDEPYSIPTALKFGVLVDIVKTDENMFVSTLQVTRVNDANEQWNWGVEYTFNKLIALRGGYKFGYDQENVTAGFGISLASLGINSMLDYGYNNYQYLPGTHTFTLEVQL
ncbi:MAG TPA: PorV/PorQ family protein [Bacteroidota bacterium]|nr:PorV/PorQ family protein [Bacteroidota bacterium]